MSTAHPQEIEPVDAVLSRETAFRALVAAWLAAHLAERGKSQSGLARELKVSAQSVNVWCRALQTMPLAWCRIFDARFKAGFVKAHREAFPSRPRAYCFPEVCT
jgi:hypothetical protein